MFSLVTENSLLFFDDSVYIIHFDLCVVRGSTLVYRTWFKLHSSEFYLKIAVIDCVCSLRKWSEFYTLIAKGEHTCDMLNVYLERSFLCQTSWHVLRSRDSSEHVLSALIPFQCPEMVPGWALRVKLTVTQLSWQSSSVLVGFPNTATSSPWMQNKSSLLPTLGPTDEEKTSPYIHPSSFKSFKDFLLMMQLCPFWKHDDETAPCF